MLQREMEMEVIARYCIRHLLLNRGLWNCFENDNALAKFWSKTDQERQEIWGKPLDIDAISAGFDSTIIDDSYLGLQVLDYQAAEKAGHKFTLSCLCHHQKIK